MKYFDLTSQEIIANPYPTYAKMRAAGPVVRGKVPFSGDLYIISRYDDIVSALTNPSLSNKMVWAPIKNKRLNDLMKPRMMEAIEQSMFVKDGNDHRRLRRLVHLAFTPKQVASMGSIIEKNVETLLDSFDRQPTVDLLSQYSSKITINVICDLIGVHKNKRPVFEKETHNFLREPQQGLMLMLRQLRGGLRVFRIIRQVIRNKKANFGDDFVSELIKAESEDGKLTEKEVQAMLFLLLVAGFQTTSHLISTGIYTLLQHPNQLELLKSDPSLIDCAVDELLRYTSTVGHGAFRKIIENTEINGIPIKKANQVVLLLSAANRDESIFEQPEIFNIQRSNNKHIAFGGGPHYCLGAALAKLEAKTSIIRLLDRFPNLSLSPDINHQNWAYTLASRGLNSVPVILNK